MATTKAHTRCSIQERSLSFKNPSLQFLRAYSHTISNVHIEPDLCVEHVLSVMNNLWSDKRNWLRRQGWTVG